MFEEGEPVIIYARTFYRESRLGFVMGPCKDHDGAIRVKLIDPDAPIKDVCVDTSKGDTIKSLQSPNGP